MGSLRRVLAIVGCCAVAWGTAPVVVQAAECPPEFIRCLTRDEARKVLLLDAEIRRLTEELRAARGGGWWRRHVGLGIGLGPPVVACSGIGESDVCLAATFGIVLKF